MTKISYKSKLSEKIIINKFFKKLNFNKAGTFNFENDAAYFNTSRNYKTIVTTDTIVENIDFFIKQSAKFLKKSGIMFVATLNQTLKSYLFAIIGAEYILKWLPIGTHDWQKFVRPDELFKICKKKI